MKVLIKGAGDLATGIASRLHNAGYDLLMTEIKVPLTVRRTVALSRAVYEGEAEVENLKGILVPNLKEAQEVISRGEIPVIVDPEAKIREAFAPDVVVDAILAKRNLGTKITDAPFVIGVGPGFTAGVDCHAVVETKRGHTLGQVIREGSAIPNTGVPGNVGGYTIERLIKASADGIMEPVAQIGNLVQKGDIVAYTGGEPVYALMTGIVRGMLQSGVEVTSGLKIGDIDARCELFHCFTISDKARSVGGGVLEAVSGFEHRLLKKQRYGLVVLAAGKSVRFGENKLFQEIDGMPMYRHMLLKLAVLPPYVRVVVSGYDEILEEAGELGLTAVRNEAPELGISHSMQLGLEAVLEKDPEITGVLFAVCDQPRLQIQTVERFLAQAPGLPGEILCAAHEGMHGNPVLFDRCYFDELRELTGDVGGKQILSRHPDTVQLIEIDTDELRDIDRPDDLTEN